MKFVLNAYKPVLSDQEIIEDIKQVAKRLGKDYISISQYKKNGEYSQCAIQGHFGTWKNALSLAGLRTERTKTELRRIQNEDYFEDLNRIATMLRQSTVTYKDYQTYGKYAPENIFRYFRTWDELLHAAGLEPTGLASHKIENDELFKEIERVWRLLGRQPTSTDIGKHKLSKYSIDSYKRRFGSWRKALEAFVVYVNADDTDTTATQPRNCSIQEIKSTSPRMVSKPDNTFETINHHRTSRNINTRLRFKVLQRDHFKCCTCGASPAKDPSVELHVDHIIPWSKGGETEMGNLQTLCSKCNLGKNNIL